MCIALPNTEQTFTVTLFLPSEGDPSFATLAAISPRLARCIDAISPMRWRSFPISTPTGPTIRPEASARFTSTTGTWTAAPC